MSEEEQTEVTQTTEVVDSSVIDAVRKQIEYYFSKENLQTDVYLQSHMDAQKAVPISVVMKFAKLKALTTDEAVIRQALVDSAVSIVDNKIRANLKAAGRCTIILRDIPAETPEEEVREIFNYEGSKTISSLRSDIGDTWFVNMEEEEDAKQTLLDLRLKKRTFRGASVKGRIKTEQVVRSYYAVPPAPLMVPPMGGMPFPPMPFPIPGGVGADGIVLPPFPYMVPALGSDPNAPSFYPDGSAESFEGDAAADANESVDGTVPDENTNEDSKNKKAGDAKGRVDSRNKSSTTRTGAKADSSSAAKGRSDRKAGTGAASTGRKSEQVTAASITATSKPPVEINAINFPPLFAHDDTPAPTPGYKEDYRKYTIDDVIAIVKTSVFDATLPAEVNAAEHSYAMGTEANLDLLKRQRTFTIDETREQLRQGRPASSGLISGAVDYRSLHYGDDTGVHHFHLLSTIEEKNEALNASVDAINASQLDMSTIDAALNESFVEQPASTSAQVAGLASPARISAASWAALVKSAAPAETTSSSHTSAPAASTSSAAASATTSAAAPRKPASTSTSAKSTSKTSAENNKKPENKKDDKKKNVAASSSSNNNNHKDSSSSNNKQPQQKQSSRKPATESAAATSEESKEGAATETAASSGPAWGGKSSFASVLKQKTGSDETPATAAASKSTATAVSSSRRNPSSSTATATKANNNNSSNNKDGSPFRSSNGHFRRTAASSSTSAAAGVSSNVSVEGSVEGGAPKKIPVAEDGMWVKETLPPWTGGKHAKNASDSA